MPPPVAPHLLTLPREIRDQIYGYLHKKLRLRTMRLSPIPWSITITITRAPCLSILLVCSRLHNEYKETICSRLLPARTVLGHTFCFPRHGGGLVPSVQNREAFARIGCATIGFDTTASGEPDQLWFTKGLEQLYCVLPRLHTLRVLHQHIVSTYSNDTLPVLPENLAFYSSTIIAASCERVRGLKLAQRGSGRTVGHWTSGYATGLSHRVVEFLATVYVATAVNVNLWTPEEVLANLSRPMRYPKQELRRLRREESDLLTVLPKKMLGWKEELYS